MRRLYALHGILSPYPQRPLCVGGRGWGEGKRENEVQGGGGGGVGTSSSECLLVFFNYFLVIFFDELSILSRVVNSIS